MAMKGCLQDLECSTPWHLLLRKERRCWAVGWWSQTQANLILVITTPKDNDTFMSGLKRTPYCMFNTTIVYATELKNDNGWVDGQFDSINWQSFHSALMKTPKIPQNIHFQIKSPTMEHKHPEQESLQQVRHMLNMGKRGRNLAQCNLLSMCLCH